MTVWPYDENTVKYRWPNGILMGNSHRRILTRTLVLGFCMAVDGKYMFYFLFLGDPKTKAVLWFSWKPQ